MAHAQYRQGIPTHLTLEQFEEFVLPHLHTGWGPQPKLALHVIFNYILKLLYLGCQWKELPIEKNGEGRPEIHYTRIYGAFRRYEDHGCFELIFAGSVSILSVKGQLDISVIHSDGTTTAAKKGGDNLGFNGHKHMKGDKVVAFCDRNCNVFAPFVSAPGNRKRVAAVEGSTATSDPHCQAGRPRFEADDGQPGWGLRQSGEPESHFQSRDGSEYPRKSARQKDDEAWTQADVRPGYFSRTVLHHRASVRLGR